MLASLGCDASTAVGTDCNTFWYYTWPPCWINSRNTWATICQTLPGAAGGGTCTGGVCENPNPENPATATPTTDWSTTIIIVAVIVGAAVIVPAVVPGGRKRR